MVKGLYEDTLKMEVILVLEVLFDLHSVCMLSYSRQPWCSRSSREWCTLHPPKRRLSSWAAFYPSPSVSSLFKVVQFGALSSQALILKDRPL